MQHAQHHKKHPTIDIIKHITAAINKIKPPILLFMANAAIHQKPMKNIKDMIVNILVNGVVQPHLFISFTTSVLVVIGLFVSIGIATSSLPI